MYNQIYIKSADTYIMCIVKVKCPVKEIRGAAILVPGFSESACDIDYFMTRLSNELNEQNYLTVQVDLFGHGDSYGDLSNLSIEIIRDNILSVYEYIIHSWKLLTVWGIARGFYGNIFCEKSFTTRFSGIICINPLKVNDNVSIGLKYRKNGVVEIRDIIYDNIVFQYLFVLMGAELTNVNGQKISVQFLDEIVHKIRELYDSENVIFLSSYNADKEICKVSYCDIEENRIEYLSERCFLRDPEWQMKLIDKLIDVIKEKE